MRKAAGNLLAIPASQEPTTSALNGGTFPPRKAIRKSPVAAYRCRLRRYQTMTRIVKRMMGRSAFLSTPDIRALPEVPPL
ncbi:hypothetical protein IFR04_015772 [Cadophora malorum]|uniref:Uncharacterized protein n=1 Tax=Cadophora malorum TaxID=108018 RepID=A0A8H7T2I1_9HELO|nr:hypothetical protein IFR04_015772 [Cadophora malorum]